MGKWITRYLVFVTGLYFITLGVVFIIRSSLGTSPISSFNYVISENSSMTLGTVTFFFNVAPSWRSYGLFVESEAAETALKF